MKLFYYATLVGAAMADGHSNYETNCAADAQCNYACDSRENCMGTGRTGLIPNRADKACCDESSAADICKEDGTNLCMELPENITAITGATCKFISVRISRVDAIFIVACCDLPDVPVTVPDVPSAMPDVTMEDVTMGDGTADPDSTAKPGTDAPEPSETTAKQGEETTTAAASGIAASAIAFLMSYILH